MTLYQISLMLWWNICKIHIIRLVQVSLSIFIDLPIRFFLIHFFFNVFINILNYLCILLFWDNLKIYIIFFPFTSVCLHLFKSVLYISYLSLKGGNLTDGYFWPNYQQSSVWRCHRNGFSWKVLHIWLFSSGSGQKWLF